MLEGDLRSPFIMVSS